MCYALDCSARFLDPFGEGHGGALNTRIKNFIRPALDNQSIRGAVQDYIVGGARKEDTVKKYGEINNWDVSKVTDMSEMFIGARSFNQPLNNWNVSNDVTDMQLMFYNAEAVRCRRQHTPAILYVETAV